MQKRKIPRIGEELPERRKHRRFKTHDSAFAALSLQLALVGRIMDISSGGLGFRYVASKARSMESSKLSILLTDGSFYFDKVPFKTIWDSPIPHEFSFGTITLRQCGLQFGQLTHSQKFDLEYFIRNYTAGEVDVQELNLY